MATATLKGTVFDSRHTTPYENIVVDAYLPAIETSLGSGTTNVYGHFEISNLDTAGRWVMRLNTDATLAARSAAGQVPAVPDSMQIHVYEHVNILRWEVEASTLSNGQNDNVANEADATLIKVTGPTAAFSITGITQGGRGRILAVRNTTSQAMTIANDHAGSTAANRILTGTGANLVLAASTSIVLLVWDDTATRWILLSARDSAGAR